MKKLIVILAMAGCSKDELPSDCMCGRITNDGINNCYWIEIRNDCSGSVESFCLDRGDWMTAYVGSDICIDQTW